MQGYCTNTEDTGSLGYNSVSDGCLRGENTRDLLSLPRRYYIITLIVMQGHRKASKDRKGQCSTSSNMVVIRSYHAGCKYRPTTWYSNWGKKLQIRNLQLRNLSMAFLREYPDGSNIGSTVYCRGEGHTIIQYDVREKNTERQT